LQEISCTSVLYSGARIIALAFIFLGLGVSRVLAQPASSPLSANEATAIGADAYTYGYPLVTRSIRAVS